MLMDALINNLLPAARQYEMVSAQSASSEPDIRTSVRVPARDAFNRWTGREFLM